MASAPDAGSGDRAGRLFVGRANVVEPFLQAVGARRQYRIQAAGTWGIGKSWLIEELDDLARARNAEVFPWIQASCYVPAADPVTDAGAEARTYVRNFDSYVQILAKLVSGSDSHALRSLETSLGAAQSAVAAIRNGPVDFHPEVHVKGSVRASEAQIGSLFLDASEPLVSIEATVTHEVWALETAFVVAIDAAASWRGAVILIDEFERLERHLVGAWLLRLVSRLTNAVVVITTRRIVPTIAGGQDVNALELTSFNESEVRAYLGARLGAAAVTDALVDRVVRFSHGLPQAVGMAADLVEQRRRSGGLQDLGDVPLDDSTPVTSTLLSKIVDEVSSEDLRTVLREGRLARRLDEDVIHHLLFDIAYEDGSDEQRNRASHALSELVAYSFVEHVEVADRDGLGRYRFHEYLRRAEPSATVDALHIDPELVHSRLATYYELRLDQYDESSADQSVYMRWYKYEQLEWQALTMEWLYHSALLRRPQERAVTRLAFAQILLSAFWWWGCYVKFDFCEQLVSDWNRTQAGSEQSWSGWLETIMRNYPRGFRKADGPGWAEVASAVRQLRESAGLTRSIPLTDAPGASAGERSRARTRRYVRAFTSLLLAHSYRYRTGMGDMALPLFDDALRYLRAVNDEAAVAWTTFELAELKAELGDVQGAVAGLATAASLAIQEEDLELLANLHRLHADLAEAADGDLQTVVDATARAVQRAYAFLVEPNPPDLYTVTFYAEMRERAAARLVSIRARESATAAGDAAESMAKSLTVLGAAPDPAAARKAVEQPTPSVMELESLLMPPPPPVGIAALDDAQFDAAAHRVLAGVRADTSDAALAELG